MSKELERAKSTAWQLIGDFYRNQSADRYARAVASLDRLVEVAQQQVDKLELTPKAIVEAQDAAKRKRGK